MGPRFPPGVSGTLEHCVASENQRRDVGESPDSKCAAHAGSVSDTVQTPKPPGVAPEAPTMAKMVLVVPSTVQPGWLTATWRDLQALPCSRPPEKQKQRSWQELPHSHRLQRAGKLPPARDDFPSHPACVGAPGSPRALPPAHLSCSDPTSAVCQGGQNPTSPQARAALALPVPASTLGFPSLPGEGQASLHLSGSARVLRGQLWSRKHVPA